MHRLQATAANGDLPGRLANCRIPICQACAYVKSTRSAWRTKQKTESIEAIYRGQCVSVDQLESTVPGLVGQMKGCLTRDRYKIATVFVDNFSNFSYVHLQVQARTAIIHANRRWPEAIDARVWPFALRSANDAIVNTSLPGKTQTPTQLFAKTNVLPNNTDQHPFGCPAYVLDGKLQSGSKINKWSARTRLAVYLGKSAQHS
jgi:hypothetical protein